jgi:4-carboxymuconolactone decarboxylase
MPQDFSKQSRSCPENTEEEKVNSMDEPNEPKISDPKALVDRRDFLGGATVLAGTSLLGFASPAGAAAPAEGVADRMPPIPADKWTDAQKKAAEEITSGPRKELVGPFIPLLRSPEFMSRLQRVGEYLRFRSSIPPRLNEFAILVTAREWNAQYEWHAHHRLALQAGLDPAVAADLAEGRRPAGMQEDETIVYNFCLELHQARKVSDATYKAALDKFGERGVMDLIAVSGYYVLVSMTLNVDRTPVPGDGTPPLRPLAR